MTTYSIWTTVPPIYIKHPSHHIHIVVCVDIQMPHEHILNLGDSDGTRTKIIQETHHLHQDTTLTLPLSSYTNVSLR